MDERTRRSFYDGIAADIARDGRTILGIFPTDDDSPPFAYTIGNALRRLPELLAVGTSKGSFLNDLSEQMIARGRAFDDGELVRLTGGRVPVKLVNASDVVRDEYTIQVGEHFGHDDYEVMQVVLPDPAGRFPGEPGCEAPWSTVPLLIRKPN